MYLYERAMIRYVTGPTGLRPYDVSAIPLNKYYQYFSEAVIVVQDKLYNTLVSIKYSDYTASFGSYKGTIQAWLDENTNTALITYPVTLKNDYNTVTFHDIQYEWFSLLPGDTSRSAKDQDLIKIADGPDIRVHKTNNSPVDYTLLGQSTLWLMNNHVVRHVYDENDIYLINAGKHFKINNNTHVCCMNFNGVGNIETLAIEKEDIRYVREGSAQFLKIKTKGVLKNKTVWMVLGGRLYMNDIVNVSDDNAVMIKINKVDWFEKIFTSREWLDLSNIIDPEVKMVDKDFFQNEDFFIKLCTDLSSFFVLIDNPNLVISYIPVREYSFPFTYYTERKESLPLLLSNGLIPKYYVRKIVGRRLLDIDAGLHKRYLFHSSGTNNGKVYHNSVNLGFPNRYNRGYLLEIKALARSE